MEKQSGLINSKKQKRDNYIALIDTCETDCR